MESCDCLKEDTYTDDIASLLDQLNFKVVNKCPGDPGYYDDTPLYPSDHDIYAVECTRLRSEMNEWKKKAKKCEQSNRQTGKTLGNRETAIVKLKQRITKERNNFAVSERKIRDTLRSLKFKHKGQITEKQNELRDLRTRSSEQQKVNSRIIKDLQLELAKRDIMIGVMHEESEQLKQDLMSKISDLKLVEGIMDDQQRALDLMKNSHKNETTCLQTQVEEIRQVFAEKEKEYERLKEDLAKETVEKCNVIDLWKKQSSAVKECNDDLEISISSFVKTYNVSIPDEEDEASTASKRVTEEGRLKMNLKSLAFLVRETLQQSSLQRQEKNEGFRDEHDNDTLDQQKLPLSDCDYSNHSGLYCFNADDEEGKENDDTKGLAAQVAAGTGCSTDSDCDYNLEQNEKKEKDEQQLYLPICSPITPEGTSSDISLDGNF